MNTDNISHFISRNHEPVSICSLPPNPTPFPEQYKKLIAIDVIHDGVYIPPEFMKDKEGQSINTELIQENFIVERDWGANLVAARIAQKLGLEAFCTVQTARCLLDFGRFPGSTRSGASHLGRFAINQPFSDKLNIRQKRNLLRHHYDRISDILLYFIR